MFSPQLTASLTKYLLKNTLQGRRRYPMVLMLEPLFLCNLRCIGCGRIREYRDVMDRILGSEECLAAVEEAGAPVVSITGGEPLLHPEIEAIVKAIMSQDRFVYLCTNGLLLEKSLDRFKPDAHLAFVLHLDGLAETHDRFAGREGVFETAISAIRAARRSGFQVLINTTLNKQTRTEEVKQLFTLLAEIPVNGIMVSPAFSYEAVKTDTFFSRKEAPSVFHPLYEMRDRVPFYNTPLFLEFLDGKLSLQCKPWSTPTRNPKGWKTPCYLLTDGHCGSFRELMEETDWSRYGVGNDARCANCMMHCGFEAAALSAMLRSPSNLWKTLRGIFSRT